MIEVLTVDGCPNATRALELAERAVREAGVPARVETVVVRNLEQAARHRFLGSPTIRVDGHDVEPGAERGKSFSLACRVYQVSGRLQGVPDERWVVEALLALVAQ